MSVPRRLNITVCHQCQKACGEEELRLEHQFKKQKKTSKIAFCCQRCMMDYFELWERVQDRVDAKVKKELKELHKRVCPACVRRFEEIV